MKRGHVPILGMSISNNWEDKDLLYEYDDTELKC